MPEIPAEISIETTGWLITLGVAIVFLAPKLAFLRVFGDVFLCTHPSTHNNAAARRAIVAHPIVLRCGVLDQARPVMGPVLSLRLDRGT
jgi:hypothetical protein